MNLLIWTYFFRTLKLLFFLSPIFFSSGLKQCREVSPWVSCSGDARVTRHCCVTTRFTKVQTTSVRKLLSDLYSLQLSLFLLRRMSRVHCSSVVLTRKGAEIVTKLIDSSALPVPHMYILKVYGHSFVLFRIAGVCMRLLYSCTFTNLLRCIGVPTPRLAVINRGTKEIARLA